MEHMIEVVSLLSGQNFPGMTGLAKTILRFFRSQGRMRLYFYGNWSGQLTERCKNRNGLNANGLRPWARFCASSSLWRQSWCPKENSIAPWIHFRFILQTPILNEVQCFPVSHPKRVLFCCNNLLLNIQMVLDMFNLPLRLPAIHWQALKRPIIVLDKTVYTDRIFVRRICRLF